MLGADEIFCLDCDANYTTLCAVPSHSVMFDFLQRYGLQPSRLLCPWGFSKQEHWGGLPCSPPGDLPNPGIEPRSPSLQVDSLPSEPPGKPKNTGVGSLFIFQGIFPTQESNWGLSHCRWILYQLSYQGRPYNCISLFKRLTCTLKRGKIQVHPCYCKWHYLILFMAG